MDMQGAFETVACGGGRSGMCVRQETTQEPIVWKTAADPYAVLGNVNWNNYTVSADVLLEQAGYAELLGRAGSQNTTDTNGQNAYYLRVSDTGGWSILRNNTSAQMTTVRSGNTTALGTGRWHTLALGFSGSTITATIDGTTVATVTDGTFAAGQVGIGTGRTETAQFDNLQVVAGAGGGTGGTTSALRNVAAGRCLDVPNASQTNGIQTELWDCNGGSNQQWTLTSGNQLQVYGNKCLDASGQGTSNGTPVVIWDCNGQANQQWAVNADGTITGAQSHLCLDASGSGTANGTLMDLWACNGGNNQKWTRS